MSSRFKGIFDTAKETENKVVEKNQTNAIPKNEKVERKLATNSRPVPIVQTRKKGTGKSSNPNYTQALAYVRKDTLQNVREKLFFDPSQDFSDLIENLLNDWIKKQK
jgi:hypothetical protein